MWDDRAQVAGAERVEDGLELVVVGQLAGDPVARIGGRALALASTIWSAAVAEARSVMGVPSSGKLPYVALPPAGQAAPPGPYTTPRPWLTAA